MNTPVKRTKNKIKNVEPVKNTKKKGGEKNMAKKVATKRAPRVEGRVKKARQQELITTAVGQFLSVMEKNDVSKPELAKRLGTSVPNVYQNLSGEHALNLRTIARMADALGCRVQLKLVAA